MSILCSLCYLSVYVYNCHKLYCLMTIKFWIWIWIYKIFQQFNSTRINRQFSDPVEVLWLTSSKNFQNYLAFQPLNLPDEGYSRNASCALNFICFFFLSNTSTGGLRLAPDGIIHPVVSASCIRYIYIRNLTFLNNVPVIDQN